MKNIMTSLIAKLRRTGIRKKTVDSVETMTLILRGMRGDSVYELAIIDDRTELRLYREILHGEETLLRPELSTACDSKTIVDLMNACGVIRWDKFHGKHPMNVLDGIMFDFTATVNGGQVIRADGSANFPKGYGEFVRELNRLLAEGENN